MPKIPLMEDFGIAQRFSICLAPVNLPLLHHLHIVRSLIYQPLLVIKLAAALGDRNIWALVLGLVISGTTHLD